MAQIELCGQSYSLPPITAPTFRRVRQLTGYSVDQLLKAGRPTAVLAAFVAMAAGTDLRAAIDLITKHIKDGNDISTVLEIVNSELEHRIRWITKRNKKVLNELNKAFLTGR